MAVETPHINFFSPQLLINNRENNINIKPNQQQQQQNFYNIPMPMSSTMHHPQSFFPEPKADSGVTYHHNNITDSRKRYRNSITNEESNTHNKHFKLSHQSSFLDQNLLHHFQNHQSEIDHLITQHTEKVRMELEEQRMKQSRMLLCAIQEAVMKKLKEKDEEIHNIAKYNLMLQDKVKSLIMENQIWREMAITNETAVNTLRNELEQVLAHINENHNHREEAEDAESSCSSNHHDDDDHRDVVEEGEETSVVVVGKMCNNCGVRESVVLLLPCRHLCLCTVCGTHIRNCPLCFSCINASVHVNFS